MRINPFKTFPVLILSALCLAMMPGCKPKSAQSAAAGDASQSFIAPGKYDEFYNIVSGGFNGQVAVYGIPSGRLFRIIPVFSQSPESGYGFSEETKPMLNTSHGFVPWDDQHHLAISQTKGEHDGRWVFAGANSTLGAYAVSGEVLSGPRINKAVSANSNTSLTLPATFAVKPQFYDPAPAITITAQFTVVAL